MKENMIAVGSYLFAGLLSFALLVAAAFTLNYLNGSRFYNPFI